MNPPRPTIPTPPAPTPTAPPYRPATRSPDNLPLPNTPPTVPTPSDRPLTKPVKTLKEDAASSLRSEAAAAGRVTSGGGRTAHLTASTGRILCPVVEPSDTLEVQRLLLALGFDVAPTTPGTAADRPRVDVRCRSDLWVVVDATHEVAMLRSRQEATAVAEGMLARLGRPGEVFVFGDLGRLIEVRPVRPRPVAAAGALEDVEIVRAQGPAPFPIDRVGRRLSHDGPPSAEQEVGNAEPTSEIADHLLGFSRFARQLGLRPLDDEATALLRHPGDRPPDRSRLSSIVDWFREREAEVGELLRHGGEAAREFRHWRELQESMTAIRHLFGH
jgi:hypothetical protein